MYTGPERRKHKRIRKHFRAQFQVMPHSEEKGQFESWNMVSTSDLGAGGVLINYDKTIKVGSLLNFKVNLPDRSEPVNCIGKTVRVEEIKDSPLVKIAAVFTEISGDEKDLIEKAAEEIYTKGQ